jgi:hypothetical protein
MAKFNRISINGNTVTYRQERSRIGFRSNISMFVGEPPATIEIDAPNIHEPYLDPDEPSKREAKKAEREANKEAKAAEKAAAKEAKNAEKEKVREAKREAAKKVREEAKAAAKAAAEAALNSVPATPETAPQASA